MQSSLCYVVYREVHNNRPQGFPEKLENISYISFSFFSVSSSTTPLTGVKKIKETRSVSSIALNNPEEENARGRLHVTGLVFCLFGVFFVSMNQAEDEASCGVNIFPFEKVLFQ